MMDVKGEVCLYGGAVMCLAFEARAATKDVDAVFKPADLIQDAARKIADRNGLRENWLSDGVARYVVEHRQRVLFEFPCLTVFIPDTDYLLAMKVLAARAGTTDRDDALLLLTKLGIASPEEVFALAEKYYPKVLLKPEVQFFVEGLFE
ncbi:MAG: hypothetical protein HY961_08330 [Ignavibacteriae bacterium]|nr:hypothetical protein [Ignavibacteriota bacterium]